MKRYEKIIMSSFCVISILALFTGCSHPASEKTVGTGDNTTGEPTADSTGEVAAGDPRYLNLEIPKTGSELFSSSTSVFYDPDRKNAGDLADNFLPEDMGLPALTVQAPESKPVLTAPVNPAATTEITPHTAPSQEIKHSAGKGDDAESKLSAARARKDKAFEQYTNVSTGSEKGDIRNALKEYQEALALLKKLEAEAKE